MSDARQNATFLIAWTGGLFAGNLPNVFSAWWVFPAVLALATVASIISNTVDNASKRSDEDWES